MNSEQQKVGEEIAKLSHGRTKKQTKKATKPKKKATKPKKPAPEPSEKEKSEIVIDYGSSVEEPPPAVTSTKQTEQERKDSDEVTMIIGEIKARNYDNYNKWISSHDASHPLYNKLVEEAEAVAIKNNDICSPEKHKLVKNIHPTSTKKFLEQVQRLTPTSSRNTTPVSSEKEVSVAEKPRKDELAPKSATTLKTTEVSPPSPIVEKTAPDPKTPEPLPKPTKKYTHEDFKNMLDDLEDVYHTQFHQKEGLRKDTFLRMFSDIGYDNLKSEEFQQVMAILDGKRLSFPTLNRAGAYMKKHMSSFKNRYKLAERDLHDFKEHYLRGFKKGDKMDDETKIEAEKRLLQILSVFQGWELSKKERRGEKVDALIKEILSPLGIRYTLYDRGSRARFSYDEDVREAKARAAGKIDSEATNSDIFFTYDMHDVVNIIEKGLHITLTDADKTNIETIMERETRDMRYKTNIKHGYNDINDVISKLEKYINKRKRIDGHVFRFSETSRFTLKQILRDAVQKNKAHGMSSDELMLRLQNLIL